MLGIPTEKSPKEIDEKYNPQKWGDVLQNWEKAYTANVPTIAGMTKKFGRQAASAWVAVQLLALYGTSNNKDKSAADSIILFAETFAPQVGGFKLSELMIFFARYKAGRYDSSFASFDARRIGNAFFKGFVPERVRELAQIMRKAEQDKVEKRRFELPQGYTSLGLYCTLKDLAKDGNTTAAGLISGRIKMETVELEKFLKENGK